MADSSRIADNMATLVDAIERNIASLAQISVDLRTSDAALNAITEGVLVTDAGFVTITRPAGTTSALAFEISFTGIG